MILTFTPRTAWPVRLAASFCAALMLLLYIWPCAINISKAQACKMQKPALLHTIAAGAMLCCSVFLLMRTAAVLCSHTLLWKTVWFIFVGFCARCRRRSTWQFSIYVLRLGRSLHALLCGRHAVHRIL